MGYRAIAVLLLGLALAEPCAAAATRDPTDEPCFAVGTSAAEYQKRVAACTALLKSELDAGRRLQVLGWRSDAYFKLNAFVRALADIGRADAISPNNPGVYYDYAFLYAALHYPARALTDIETAMRLGLHSAEAYGLRGSLFAYLGKLGDATQDLEIAVVSKPSLPGVRLMRGFVNLEAGEIDRAITDLSEEIRLNPKDADAHYYRGRAYFALDHYAEALADFEQSLHLDPTNLAAAEDIEDVRSMMAAPSDPPAPPRGGASPTDSVVPSKAVGRSHNCAAYYPSLALHLFEAGDVLVHYDVGADGAISNVGIGRSSGSERLDRAAVICVSRHWRNTPASKGGVPFATPQHEAIIRYMGRPHTDESFFTERGEAYAAQGDYALAMGDFNQLIAKAPSDTAYFKRGFLRYVLRDYAGAIQDFDAAIRLKPDFDEAIAARDLARSAGLEAIITPPGKGI